MFLWKSSIYIAVLRIIQKLAADLPVQWFFRGNEITKEKYSILKFEAVTSGLSRKLIVKNISADDFQRFSISCEGQIQNAVLKKQAVFKKSLKVEISFKPEQVQSHFRTSQDIRQRSSFSSALSTRHYPQNGSSAIKKLTKKTFQFSSLKREKTKTTFELLLSKTSVARTMDSTLSKVLRV